MELLIAAKARPQNQTELELEEVLRNSDVLVILIPGTEPNRNYLNADRIGLLKQGALVINTARGSVMDYQALEAAVREGKITGVGLDVFPEEPTPGLSLFEYPQVICTPHLAYFTREALDKMNVELVENLLGAEL
jgi:phosphoglycerate dehydrogenase-like enzyme